ncbi:response regulator [Nitrosophilus kaiyonis]|uniref:response regulator n=1 Tax=Nitrosophilus kaiyonis TaxID=2930200 RepID=UPI00248F6589|nr:response regulator [Nitrosophilus kaiyonis]
MKIIIVENEIYLAQSIAAKLAEIGHTCEVAATIKEAIKDEHYDAVLLSTNINGQDFYPVIEHYKDSIIILLVSYISNDTVSNPLKAGAKDYILKPFMMEELIRKINHFRDYEKLKKENDAFKKYLQFSLKGINIDNISTKTTLPLLIKTNYQKFADFYAFEFAKIYGEPFKFYSLSDSGVLNRIKSEKDTQLLYITDFQTLKKSEKKSFFEIIENKNALISTTEAIEEDIPLNFIELKSDNKIFDRNDILSIDDYVKYIILNYQNKFPDTALAKKLGISRKSLWEKRKKYEIFKKK